MANTTTQQILFDGPRIAVLKWWLASDGSSGELSDLVVADASALEGAPTTLTILRVDWALIGFDAYLEWDATTDVPILAMPQGYAQHVKFTGCHGPNGCPNTKATGYTGDILLNTSGFTAATDRGHVILTLRKD